MLCIGLPVSHTVAHVNFDAFRKNLGANVRRARFAQGMTQEEVASKAASLRTYTGLERGTANVSLEVLHAIARALKVDPAALLIADPKVTVEAFERISQATADAVPRGRKPRARKR